MLRRKRTIGLIVLNAAALGLGAFLLSLADYRYQIRDLKLEFYLLVVALLFGGIGAWVAFSLAGRRKASLNPKATNAAGAEIISEQANAAGLSERELEVLQAVACGMSNQQIAEHLHVSLSTVKTHNASVFSKLGVQRRTQAVNEAIRLGILKHSVEDHTEVR
ncbi:MAG: response regulator transcription factor [Bacteroidetes bacterium]|nr:response regulator transcription factor [Bacteroidota bacterium]